MYHKKTCNEKKYDNQTSGKKPKLDYIRRKQQHRKPQLHQWTPPVESHTNMELTTKLRIVAGPSKYIYTELRQNHSVKINKNFTVHILREDLYMSEPVESDDDVIYIKTTGPPKINTNSYGY